MKVSRKVARRSHRSRYSSVSRRRLRNKKSRSGYKKKHAKTQRGGARSRKYGHKRGKRFHRGGESKNIGSVIFFVKKNVTPSWEQEQTFEVVIDLSNGVATITLTRTNPKPEIVFTIEGNFTNVRDLLISPGNIKKMKMYDDNPQIDLQNLEPDNGGYTYDFYRNGRNNNIFKKIHDELVTIA